MSRWSLPGVAGGVLFPPEQAANLYVGPLDMTMAGQPTSMVDLEQPDLARFPRFASAQASAQMVLLEPGDAIYIPAMWWAWNPGGGGTQPAGELLVDARHARRTVFRVDPCDPRST